MINFNILSPKSKVSVKNKKVVYKIPIGESVYSPVNGKVLNSNDRECGGNLTIVFDYGGEKYIMSICGIDSLNMGSGYSIREGDKIGESTKRSMSIEILDDKNKPIDLSKFDTEDEKSKKNSDDSILKNMVKIALTPMDAIKGVLPKRKNESVKNRELIENIQRIKKLLK
jgi:hypothetical protein